MRITNKLNLPEALIKQVSTERHNSAGTISATTLLKGTNEILLTERHWDNLEDDVSNRIWALFGTATHSLLEHEGENEVTEERLAVDVDGVKITGQFDNYNLETGVISDYKTASIWKVKFNDFSDWHKQGLIYAWLLKTNSFKVSACRFIALLKDHSKTQAKRDADYPQEPIYIYEFKVNDEDIKQIDEYIKSKVKMYLEQKELPDKELTPCSEEERWAKPTKYAVMKDGRKTAIRVLDTEEEALNYISKNSLGDKHYVEHRQGENTKCDGYCLVKDYCQFYKTYKEEV